MVKIINIRLKGTYKILWLRYITGVNLREHCMKSFLGTNDKRVRGFTFEFKDMALEKSEFYYFCGVDVNWDYNKNIHLAFREKQGSVIKIDNQLYSAEIQNAEQLPISNKCINHNLPQSKNKLYNTCRNWWFANQLAVYYSQNMPAPAPIQTTLF